MSYDLLAASALASNGFAPRRLIKQIFRILHLKEKFKKKLRREFLKWYSSHTEKHKNYITFYRYEQENSNKKQYKWNKRRLRHWYHKQNIRSTYVEEKKQNVKKERGISMHSGGKNNFDNPLKTHKNMIDTERLLGNRIC